MIHRELHKLRLLFTEYLKKNTDHSKLMYIQNIVTVKVHVFENLQIILNCSEKLMR